MTGREYNTAFPFPEIPNPRPEFPTTPPIDATLADLAGWWLEVQCECSSSKKLLPFRLMAARSGWTTTLGQFTSRLKCKACGNRPSSLVMISDAAGAASRLDLD